MQDLDYNGIASVITAIGILISIIVSAYNSIRLKEVAAKVDGAATAQTTKIEQLTNQVSELKGTVAEQKKDAAVAQAVLKVVVPPVAAPQALAQDHIAKEIAVNTKEIAVNTQDLKDKT